MARSVCIKVGGVMYCTGSPIKDCSCEQDVAFKDPYPETPERVEDWNLTVDDVKRVFETWSKTAGTSGRVDKLYAISAITRLILTPGVDLAGPFVIMSLVDGMDPPVKAR